MQYTNTLYTSLRKDYPRTWRIWYRMNKRCSVPQAAYEDIEVCESWNYELEGSQGFINFLDDMGPMETETKELYRLDASKDYTPENTIWNWTHNRNTNQRWTTTERGQFWSKVRELGIKRHTIYSRLRRGWTKEQALHKDTRPYINKIRKLKP